VVRVLWPTATDLGREVVLPHEPDLMAVEADRA
jgi:hypothetical protein